MTKNKKKLRRAERRYSVTKSAQTLVLAGMLLAGGVSGAMAAAANNDGDLSNGGAASTDWTITGAGQLTSGGITQDGNTSLILNVIPGTGANNIAATIKGTAGQLTYTTAGSLNITGAVGSADKTATLTVGNDGTYATTVVVSKASISGANANAFGKLIIDASNTGAASFTTTLDDGTVVGNFGSLELKGATADAIASAAVHTGNVTLNGTNATLTVIDGGSTLANNNLITGNLNITNGTVDLVGNAATAKHNYLNVDGDVIVGTTGTLNLGGAADADTAAGNHGTLTAKNFTYSATVATALAIGDDGGTLPSSGAGKAGGNGTLTVTDFTATTALTIKAGNGGAGNATGVHSGGVGGSATINTKNLTAEQNFTLQGGTGGTAGGSTTSQANGGDGGNATVNISGAGSFTTLAITGGGVAAAGANNGSGGNATMNVQGAGADLTANTITLTGDAGTANSGLQGEAALKISAATSGTDTAGATFDIGTLSLRGVQAITDTVVTIGDSSQKGTTTGSIETLDFGADYDKFGTVTLAGAAGKTTELTVTNLPKLGTGTVEIGANSTLSITNDFAINSTDILGSTAASTKLVINAAGTLHVGGTLALTDATPDLKFGTIIAKNLTANNGGLQALKLTGGNGQALVLLGGGLNSSPLTAGAVTLDSAGKLQLGHVDYGTGQGGTITNALTTTNGSITVAAGDWKITNNNSALNLGGNGSLVATGGALEVALGTGASKVLTVGSTDGLDVSGGSVNITGDGGLTVAASSNFKVDGGTLTTTKLDASAGNTNTITNGTVEVSSTKAGGGDYKAASSNTGGKIEVGNLGVLKVDFSQVWNNTTSALLGNVYTDVLAGGTMLLGGGENLSFTITGTNTLATLKGILATGSAGLINIGDAKISGVTANGSVEYTDVESVTSNDLLTSTATGTTTELADATGGFKNLQITGTAPTTDVAISPTGTLQFAGSEQGVQLVEGLNGHKALMTVKDGQTLTFGVVDPAEGKTTKGTLTGDVTLTDGTAGKTTNFNAVNGEFIVTGDVKGTANGTSTAITVGKGKLEVQGSFTNTANTAVNLTEGGLEAKAGAVVLGAVSLHGGQLINSDVATTANANYGNLTVGAVTTSGEGNKLSAGNDLTVGSFKQVDEDGNDVAGKVSNATITAGDAFTLTTGNLDASKVTINAKSIIVSAGDVTLAEGSSLTAMGVKPATGATGTDESSTISGALTLTGATANVGDLSVGANTDLTKGASLTAKTLTAGGNITVGSNEASSTGKLSAEVLALDTHTLFVDPAWVDGKTTHETGYASQVAVKSFSAVEADASKITGKVIGGQASQITLGSTDLAWVQKKLDAYNATHGTNIWGNDDNLVSAALGIVSPFTVTTGSLVVDGSRKDPNNPGTVDANTAYFGENSLLIVDANSVGADKTALKAGNINVAENAKLMLTNATVGTKYSVAEATGTLDIEDGSWDGKNILTDHRLLAGVLDDTTDPKKASVTINQRSATSVLPGLSSEMGGLIDNMIKQNHTSENSPHAGVRFANRAINRLNGDQAAATIEGAAQLAVVGAAPAMTLSAVQAGTSTVTTRTSFASPLMDSSKAVALHKDVDGTLSVDSGLSAGNGMKNGFGLWIMPLYQSNSAWGMKADGFKGGYKSDLGGVALGADYTVNDMFRFGLAFNIGGGYAESNGDFNKTENSFSFWGINAYGGWAMNNFGITADVGYTGNYNKLQQELPGAMGMSDIKSDVNSSAWTAGLRGEYKFATEALDIIPHVGVRYTGLTTDEYKAKSGGDTVFKVDQDFQSIWTFPIGVTLAKEIETGSGWIIRPQVDLGITPATGDVKAKSKVRIPGVDGSAEMKMQVVDYMSYDGGLGLEMKKDNVSFGINYNIQASEHRTGHGVFGTFRYEF